MEDQSQRIWVGGLPEEIDEADLMSQFEKFGSINHVKIIRGAGPRRDTYAFIQYTEARHAEDAIRDADQTRVAGSTVKVGPARNLTRKSANPRQRSRSRSRSPSTRRRRNRSRSRSRSRSRAGKRGRSRSRSRTPKTTRRSRSDSKVQKGIIVQNDLEESA